MDCVNILYICIYYLRCCIYGSFTITSLASRNLLTGPRHFRSVTQLEALRHDGNYYVPTGEDRSRLVSSGLTGHYLVPTGDDVWFQLAVCRTVTFPVTFEGHFGGLLTVVTSCEQLTRDLLAIAKFLVGLEGCCLSLGPVTGSIHFSHVGLTVQLCAMYKIPTGNVRLQDITGNY